MISYGIKKIEIGNQDGSFVTVWEEPERLPRKEKKKRKKRVTSVSMKIMDISACSLKLLVGIKNNEKMLDEMKKYSWENGRSRDEG